MKIRGDDTRVQASGGLEGTASGFQIKANAHAFRMLSSGLYSNKIAAVLREIGCNAHDAHIAGGCASRPIEVKLPNQIDPQFYIKDWGPGLSHEDVMNLYVSYFTSTKQDSNDFTGAFGLGSKSPFSYTDSFTVTSVHGGKKRIYSAHIGDDGSPSIVLMETLDADDGWEHGMMVGFPVNPSDFGQFRVEAQDIFRFFDPLPTIIGGEAIKPVQYALDRGKWALTSERIRSNNLHVKMGNVVYPLRIQSLQDWQKNPVLTAMVHASPTLLRFPLGSLMVAASREDLQFDKRSQQQIVDILREIATELVREVDEKWEEAKQGGWPEKARFVNTQKAISNGLSLTEELLREVGAKDPAGLHAALSERNAKFQQVDRPSMHVLHLRKSEYAHGKLTTARPFGRGSRYFPFDENMVMVVGDEDNAYNRVRLAILRDELSSAILVTPVKAKNGTLAEANRVKDQLLKDFGKMEVIPLADFPPPPKAPKAKGGKGKAAGLPPLPATAMLAGEDTELAARAEKIYVVCKRANAWGRRSRKIILNNEVIDRWSRTRLEQELDDVNKAGADVCLEPLLVTANEAKRFKLAERKEWTLYDDHLRDKLSAKAFLAKLEANCAKHREHVPLAKHVRHSGIAANLASIRKHNPTVYQVVEPALAKHKKLAKSIEKLIKLDEDEQKNPTPWQPDPIGLDGYKSLARRLSMDLKVKQLRTVAEEMNDEYPAAAKIETGVFDGLAQADPSGKLLAGFVGLLLEVKP